MSSFLWACVGDTDGPVSTTDIFIVYGLTEGVPKSAAVLASDLCSLNLCLPLVKYSPC